MAGDVERRWSVEVGVGHAKKLLVGAREVREEAPTMLSYTRHSEFTRVLARPWPS
jgi:hypothetical protein